jgi:hypothetical protein
VIEVVAASAGLSPTVVQIIIGVVGTSGVIGAFVALAKLKPDVNSAAVTQSQGAIETMAILQRQLEDERNQWRERALNAEQEADKCKRKAAELEVDIERLRDELNQRRRPQGGQQRGR